MKVAFTTTDGRTVDQHFGMATEYHVWEIGPEAAEPLVIVSPLVTDGDEEDRTTTRANAVEGCAIVCTQQIGGPAAAKLVARRIHPMKTGGDVPIAEVVARLQQVLRGSPPPWLRKVLHADAPEAAPSRSPTRHEAAPLAPRAPPGDVCGDAPAAPASTSTTPRSSLRDAPDDAREAQGSTPTTSPSPRSPRA